MSKKNNLKLIAIAVVTLISSLVFASSEWKVTSPDKNLSAVISQAEQGKGLCYRIESAGKEILPPADLGVTTKGKDGDFTKDFIFVCESNTTIDGTYPRISGKKSLHRNNANEKTLAFKNAAGELIHVIFRAYNDGIAYRYHFPGSGCIEITAESSAFSLPDNSVGWLQNYRLDYQGFYPKTGSDDEIKNDIAFPALFHTPTGVWVLVTEAAVYGNYAGCRLEGSLKSPAKFQIKFPQDKITNNLPVSTPWRAIIMGNNLGTIVESVIVDNLNPACEIDDTSWIKPGRVAFPWISDHNANESLETLKSFIDLAADMGWEWVEVDFALIGNPKNYKGSDKWLTTEWVPELIEYAKKKGVDIYGWDNWENLKSPEEREKVLGLYQKMGIKGIKVDFVKSDAQDTFKWRDDLMKDCAKYKMMVSFHGSTLPRGQNRRWPNILTWESVLGEEWYTIENAWDPCPPPTPTHNCTIPFTRNVVGPMDYTPVYFTNEKRTTTDGHELALSVIFESAWQCFADGPQGFNASKAKPFLKEVPVAWDDIRFIDGYPGEFICLARRKGSDWFVAAINADKNRDIVIPLDFLKKGTYSVTIYKDNPQADGLAVENLTIDTAEPLKIATPANGGFCLRIFGSAIVK